MKSLFVAFLIAVSLLTSMSGCRTKLSGDREAVILQSPDRPGWRRITVFSPPPNSEPLRWYEFRPSPGGGYDIIDDRGFQRWAPNAPSIRDMILNDALEAGLTKEEATELYNLVVANWNN